MNSAARLLYAVGLPLLLGCGASDDGVTSPFQGDGRIDIDGVVVAMRVEGDLLRAAAGDDPPPQFPDGVRADFFILDADVCGGPIAAVFRGADPVLLTEALLESGWIVREEGGRERFRLGSVLDPMTTFRGMGGLPGRMARARERLDPRARPSVKRVVRGAHLMLTPTVDLRDDLWRLSDAMDLDLPRDADLAVAVDGPRSARLVDREILPAFRAAGALFDLLRASGPGGGGPTEEISAASIVRVLASTLDGLEGAVLRPEGESYRMTFDFEVGGSVDAIFKARRGAWPAGGDAATEVSLSVDLARAAGAFFTTLASDAADASTGAIDDTLDFESPLFPLDGRIVATSGRRGGASADEVEDAPDPGLSVAFGIKSGVTDAAVLEWQRTSEHVLATWIRRLRGGEDVPVHASDGWLWCGQVLQPGAPMNGDAFLRFRVPGLTGSAHWAGNDRIVAEFRRAP